MNEIPDHPVYSKNVLEFITVAHDYCLTMSKPEKLNLISLTEYLRKVLPLLYVKADLLPDVQVNNPEANQRFVTEENWQALFNHLRRIFHKKDEFWFVDQSANTADMVKGSLAEHFTDIFQDLKDFIDLYQQNSLDAKENAVSEVKRLFYSNWGKQLVNALKTLHSLSIDTEEPEDLDIPKFL